MGKKNKKNKKNNQQNNYQHNPVVEIGSEKPTNEQTSSKGTGFAAVTAQAKESRKNGKTGKITSIVVGILIVVAVVLGITLGGGNEEKAAEREARKAERAEQREAKKSAKEEQKMEEEQQVDGISAQAMQPVEDGEFLYSFDGVTWVFEQSDEPGARVPVTVVKAEFDNFSRRAEGTPVTFGKPFYFGVFEGECTEVASVAYDNEAETGNPLGFVECASANATTNLILFQENTDLVLKMHKSDEEGDTFTEVRTIDMTTMVE